MDGDLRNIPRLLAMTDQGKYFPVVITIEWDILVFENSPCVDGGGRVAPVQKLGDYSSPEPTPEISFGGKKIVGLFSNVASKLSLQKGTTSNTLACDLVTRTGFLLTKDLFHQNRKFSEKGKEVYSEGVRFEAVLDGGPFHAS